MLVPIAILLLVLFTVLFAALFRAKRRFIDHVPGPPDIRPNDREMTARPDLTNPPVATPPITHAPWTDRERRY